MMNPADGYPYPPGNPLAPPAYQPDPAPSQVQISVIERVVVVQAQVPTDFPVRTLCSACHATGLTNVTYKTGALTWLWCGLLGVWGIWPFCLIPFCCDACKDVEHRCPYCHNLVHIHRRM